ncbi:hypothetical protein [Cytobacillus massiliigabonensis]|uniref:hypothetical protein n=1 Tax=Cytobacillus massiliigabonensis TaxID=1871011 RepID=UPI0038990579
MNVQNVKGTQDYLPNAEVVRREITKILEPTFIQYGCKPLETPILNNQFKIKDMAFGKERFEKFMFKK